MNWMVTLAAAVSLAVPTAAAAHGGHPGAHWFGGLMSFGSPGEAQDVAHEYAVTIEKTRCTISGDLTTWQGDTLAFVVQNRGDRTSELVLGNIGAVAEHARLAVRDPALDHETHAMVHVEPGRRETLYWRFTRVGIFEYGCFVPDSRVPAALARITVLR